MTGEKIFLLLIVIIVVVVIAITQLSKHRNQIKRLIQRGLKFPFRFMRRSSHRPGHKVLNGISENMTVEEKTKAELSRLRKRIEERKQVAQETDITHHLWGLYKIIFLSAEQSSLNQQIQDDEWYAVKIQRARSGDGLNEFEFELKGASYKFVDDEERQGWSDNLKYFSLFLYDASGRCLIEVSMKVRVDKMGRSYSVMSDGPKAFLPGDWMNDFINVKLKNQSMRNRETRSQKHQERLREIEDLKDRFGIWD